MQGSEGRRGRGEKKKVVDGNGGEGRERRKEGKKRREGRNVRKETGRKGGADGGVDRERDVIFAISERGKGKTKIIFALFYMRESIRVRRIFLPFRE